MDIIFSVLFSMLFPFLVIGGIVALIIMSSKKRTVSGSALDTTPGAEKELSNITYLLKAIDEAIEEGTISQEAGATLQQKYHERQRQLSQVGSSPQPQPEVKDVPVPVPVERKPQITLEVPPRQNLSLAQITRWLLYIGVFLLFIATMLFAIYKWQSFSEEVKFLILLGVTASFYLGGWYVSSRIGILKGGLALAIVGAIMTFFDAYILLDAKDSLNNYLYWAAAISICSLIYLFVAFLFKHVFFTYLSGTAQVLTILALGKHFAEIIRSEAINDIAIQSVFFALVALSCLWFIAEVVLARKNVFMELFEEPLFYLAQILAAITFAFQIPVFIENFDTPWINWQVLAIAIIYHALLIVFYSANYWYRRYSGYLYPCFLAQVSVTAITLVFFAVSTDYFILIFIGMAALWLLLSFAIKIKAKDYLEFLQRPLFVSSVALSVITSVAAVFKFAELIYGQLNITVATPVDILSFSCIAIFFLLAAVYEKNGSFAYPSLLFLALSIHLLGFRIGIDFILLFSIVAILWLLLSWGIRTMSKDYLEFLRRPLFISSIIVSGTVSCAAILKFIDLMSQYRTISVTAVDILSFFVITTFFIMATIYERKELFVYPSILFSVLSVHLLGLYAGVEPKFMAIPISLISVLIMLVSLMLSKYRLEYISRGVLNGFFAVSVYSVVLGLGYQPALIAVFLINACAYFALAITSRHQQTCIWISLTQTGLALFVALNYYEISHLFANVSYVSLYLATFSISLAFKETGLIRIKAIAHDIFNFSAVFCLVQLIIQIYGALSHTYGLLPDWIFDPSNGINILMFALIIAGFFYVTSSNLYDTENLIYLGFLCFLVAYITKLGDLKISFIEWYSIPIGIYLISMGYLYQNRHPESKVSLYSNLTGLLIILGSSTVAFMLITKSPDAQLHALFSAFAAIIFLVIGVLLRTKVFFIGGILFLSWNALYQSWGYIYALPKWLTIGILGLISIIAAVYLEQNREKFIEFSRNVRRSLAEDWD